MTMLPPPPPATRLRELIDDRALLMPLTVDRYHEMIELGFVTEGEPWELLDGYLVRKDRSAAGEDPMSVGHEHILAVNKLARLSRKLEPLGCFLQTQQPVSLPPFDEPEPDGSIVLGSVEDYAERLPGAGDVTCVIEVADSSLRRDRITKLRIYASSGIARYVIINLPDRVIEVYTQPLNGNGRTARYGQSTTLTGRQPVELPAAKGKRVTVPARSLLP